MTPLLLGLAGLKATQEELDALQRLQPLGIILFTRNIESPEQTRALIAACQDVVDHPLAVTIDEEGGRVKRLPAVPVGDIPPPERSTPWSLAAQGIKACRKAGFEHGRWLAAWGITHNLAPVFDLGDGGTGIVGDRAFGATPGKLSPSALAWCRGMLDAGIKLCAKHFPGHGMSAVDSHHGLPVIPEDADFETHLAPFRAAVRAGIEWMMIAHLDLPVPATAVPGGGQELAPFSPYWLRTVLREQLGFTGLTISDDLGMKAVAEGRSVAEIAEAMIRAGCDVLIESRPDPAVWLEAAAGIAQAKG